MVKITDLKFDFSKNQFHNKYILTEISFGYYGIIPRTYKFKGVDLMEKWWKSLLISYPSSKGLWDNELIKKLSDELKKYYDVNYGLYDSSARVSILFRNITMKELEKTFLFRILDKAFIKVLNEEYFYDDTIKNFILS